jgi:hypothetical protein
MLKFEFNISIRLISTVHYSTLRSYIYRGSKNETIFYLKLRPHRNKLPPIYLWQKCISMHKVWIQKLLIAKLKTLIWKTILIKLSNMKMSVSFLCIWLRVYFLTLLDSGEGVDSTTISKIAKFRLILLYKRVPRLFDFNVCPSQSFKKNRRS